MADTNNGGAAPQAQGRRQVIINAQYVKDLSFENPRAPHSLLQQQGPAPEVQINVDVKAATLAPDIYEVVMTLRADAKQATDSVFVVELVYGAVVSLANTPQDDVSAALMVETPRMLFPFARSILAEVTRDGGFTPLLLNPIDFSEIYSKRSDAGVPPVAPGAGPGSAAV
jgi:preprotein translocase subunit SecB